MKSLLANGDVVVGDKKGLIEALVPEALILGEAAVGAGNGLVSSWALA